MQQEHLGKNLCNPSSSQRNSQPSNQNWTQKFLLRNTWLSSSYDVV